MARIAGVDIPREKRVEIALTYIYGIGRSRADEILAATGISPDLRVKDLSDEQLVPLRDYIEATYHISHPQIVDQRRTLLDKPGVIAQTPYLESTPRYVAGERFESLDLPPAALEMFDLMARPTADGGLGLLHNPPYAHQAKALVAAVRNQRSLVVTTGTGSGKTESFLLPIIAKLAAEAKDRSVHREREPYRLALSRIIEILKETQNALRDFKNEEAII